MLGLDQIHAAHDQAEAVSHIDDRSIYSTTAACGKYQPDWISLPADRKRVDFSGRSAVGNRRAYLEHVRTEHLAAIFQVIGVVLHEGRSAFEAVTHDLHRAYQGRRLPITLGSETVAI